MTKIVAADAVRSLPRLRGRVIAYEIPMATKRQWIPDVPRAGVAHMRPLPLAGEGMTVAQRIVMGEGVASEERCPAPLTPSSAWND